MQSKVIYSNMEKKMILVKERRRKNAHDSKELYNRSGNSQMAAICRRFAIDFDSKTIDHFSLTFKHSTHTHLCINIHKYLMESATLSSNTVAHLC